jgi:glycosyltransferase involved in cell wall biosynthesis
MTAGLSVSVIIPVRNGGPLFAEQLDALVRQTFDGEWELLVVDNGSTDGSEELAESYARKLPVRIVDASDGAGPAYARNVGAARARGRFLAYCDADDVVADDWLSELCAAADPHAIVGGAYDQTAINPPDILKVRGSQWLTELPDGPFGFLRFAGSANVLVPRDLLIGLGGWDESLRYAEDVDLSWRTQLAGYPLVFAANAVVHYRHRTNLSALYRQLYNYSKWHCELLRRYRRFGAKRSPAGEVVRQWWKIVSRLPYLFFGRRRRYVWAALLAGELGRIDGTLRRHEHPPRLGLRLLGKSEDSGHDPRELIH